MMNKIHFITILAMCMFADAFAQVSSSKGCVQETFTFQILKGKKQLSGTLSIPSDYKEGDPVVVLVSSPQPIQRDYHGLFSSLSDSLGRKGIATLRYDNRAFSDSGHSRRDDDRYSMFDVAQDAHGAYVALRKDRRFMKSPIGLMGHSEGGAAAAIETSQNKDIAFLVVLSTIGIPGEQLAYAQMTSSMEIMFSNLPDKERNAILYSYYAPIHIIATQANNKSARKQLVRYSKNSYLSTPAAEIKKKYGNQTLQQVIDNSTERFMKPRLLAYFRFDPQRYYSIISCPVLAAWGKKDQNLDWRNNLNGLERIFMEAGKTNYTIIAKDSLNHGYETIRGTEDAPMWMHAKKDKRNVRSKGYSELCNSIVEWIKCNAKAGNK